MVPVFNQNCRELMCLAQGHNMVPLVGIEPRTSRFGPTLYHYATANYKLIFYFINNVNNWNFSSVMFEYVEILIRDK